MARRQGPSPSDDSSSSGSDASSSSDNEHIQPPSTRPAKKPKTVTAAPLSVSANLSQTLQQQHSTSSSSSITHPIIVILDQASLETVKNKRGVYELLNCDDHRDVCKKQLKKDPNIFRPDILHQELLALLDAPLNKAGLLKIYIQTTKHVLIDVHPSIRIPRTYKRFAGLFVQLLHKMKIKAQNESKTLLKVIKNPVSQYLPAGTRAYGLSSQGTLYRPMALARELLTFDNPQQAPHATCFVIGAMSTGHVRMDDYPFIEQMISVSEYPLSGAAAIARLLGAMEERWGVV